MPERSSDIRRYDVFHLEGTWMVVSFDARDNVYFIGDYDDAVKAYSRASHLQRKLRAARVQAH